MLRKSTGTIGPFKDLKSIANNLENKEEVHESKLSTNITRLFSFTKKTAPMILFFVLSIIFHLFVIESVYVLSVNNEDKKNELKRVAIRIENSEGKKLTEKTINIKNEPVTKKMNSMKKNKPTKIKSLSKKEMIALGNKYISDVKKGRFPSLTISYDNPSVYIKEMYDIGGKTIIYNKKSNKLYEINLISKEIVPFDKKKLNSFSSFKRVIRDSQWNLLKRRVATDMNTTSQSIDILLLVPTSVETLWIGNQAHLFHSMNLKVSDVETVEADFQKGEFSVKRLMLKDGRSLNIKTL